MADNERVSALDGPGLSQATGGIRYFTDDLSAIVEEKFYCPDCGTEMVLVRSADSSVVYDPNDVTNAWRCPACARNFAECDLRGNSKTHYRLESDQC